MDRIYLDNAATSFPKAPGLGVVVGEFLDRDCVNINRTESPYAEKAFDFLHSLRSRLGSLYGYPHPECIGFTANVTEALNWLIKGLLTRGDHVLVTSLEHNSVMRPLVQCGIPFSRIPCDGVGRCLTGEVEKLILPNTKAMIINVCSNVSGTVQDVGALAEIARKHGLLLFLDTAQASPFRRLDMQDLGVAAIAFTGHKGMLGPEGTGGFLLRKDLALGIPPLVSGGTGSMSDSEEIPPVLPDRLSAGTENLPGLRGLEYSLGYVMDHMDELETAVSRNTCLLFEKLKAVRELKIVGPGLEEERTNVISVTSDACDIADLASFLGERGIETRVGMHCAPAAHKALGTFPQGTLRFSPGPFTTAGEIQEAVDSIVFFFR